MNSTRPASKRPRAYGLSLLEVVVTVAIFSMLFAVLMTGWHQSMKAQAQLAGIADGVKHHRHIAAVMRQLLNEALNPQLTSGQKFVGKSDGFLLESTSALDPRMEAAPLAVEVRVTSKGESLEMQIRHDGQVSGAFPWAFTQFKVRYIDSAGQTHVTWPPEARPGQPAVGSSQFEHLPSLIAVDYLLRGDRRTRQILASPRNTAWELAEPTPPSIGIGLQ